MRNNELEIIIKSAEKNEYLEIIQYLMTKIHSLTDVIQDSSKEIQ